MPALTPMGLSIGIMLLANLLPLWGALMGQWSVYELILLYWAENVLIGLYQLARFGAVGWLRDLPEIVVLAAFFTVHYGMFTLVHGMFVVGMFGPSLDAGLEAGVALLLSPDGLLVPLLLLAASHGFSFVVHFLRGGEWRDAGPKELMLAPYGRVVVLHLAILGGGALVVMTGQPVAALVLLVVLKMGVEVVAHRWAHGRALSPPNSPPSAR